MKLRKYFKLLVLVLFVALGLFACDKPEEEQKEKEYTYNTYTSVSPSNWNELTYQDSNDTQIMSYIGSAFFQYDFKFDANGEIVPGEFEIKYGAATKLEDVSEEYIGEGAKAQAYKITLREDLKWDDEAGTPIKAEDFVYTMEQQLDPKFKNYRADSFYVGATVIKNAENFAKQGDLVFESNGDSTETVKVPLNTLVKGEDGVYAQANGRPIKFALTEGLAYLGGKSVTAYASYLDAEALAALKAKAGEDGRVDVTDETIELVKKLINTESWGFEGEECVPLYTVFEKEYAQMDFSEVGIKVGDTPYELIVILDFPLALLDDEGNLTYKAAYNFSSLPLVKRDLYEANKVEPSEGTTLWTSTYNSDVNNTASWGPYKLSEFQAGKSYTLVKNDNWYGYSDKAYEGQYQTTKIVCETIEEWNTAWMKFQSGEIDGIGIDVTIADDYKSSERAYYTPDDFVASLQLQSSKEGLANRQEAGVNKVLLTYDAFRKALSLSINRNDFAKKTTTSSLAGYGLFNSMHYYDVANGGVYRNEDVAKQVLCDVYGVDVSKYGSLDEAVDSITGYNLDLARTLVNEAVDAAVAAGDYNGTDKVVLTFGSAVINDVVQRRFDYIKEAWTELAKGTKLEGKLEFDQKEFGDAWANDFRAGAYDVCMGGWSGAAWDPGYFLLAYLSPAYMYSAAWDTSAEMLQFTMVGAAEDGSDITDTLSLIEWYNCLNGAQGCKYNFGAGFLEESKRLTLIAALEKAVLSKYYSVPLYNSFGASLISYKIEYVTYEYNTFMGYGGVQYMTYNYDDAAWAQKLAESNYQLDYKG